MIHKSNVTNFLFVKLRLDKTPIKLISLGIDNYYLTYLIRRGNTCELNS